MIHMMFRITETWGVFRPFGAAVFRPFGGAVFRPFGGAVFRPFGASIRPFSKEAVLYGWVYAFYSPSMPGLVKIGMTTRTPELRLEEANKGDTWRPPEKYRILCALRVRDPWAKEKETHAVFAHERIGTREFFRLSHADVLKYFRKEAFRIKR